MIEPEHIDELELLGFPDGIPSWCARNGIDEKALLRVVELYGSEPIPPAAIVCAFQLGFEARRRAEGAEARRDGDDGEFAAEVAALLEGQ